MFRLLRNKIKLMGLLNNNNFNNQSTSKPAPTKLTTQLKKNIEELTNILGTSTDIVLREFVLGQNQDLKACLLFIDGLVNKTIINDQIIKPLMYDINLVSTREASKKLNLSDIKSTLLAVGDVKQQDSILEIMAALLSGDTVLLLHGSQEALLIDTKGWESRAISEPSTEKTVRGPREGFVETLRFNTALLRRKIKNPNFTLEQMLIGEQTHTYIALAYVKGITNPKLVEEVKRRLKRIKIDGILESGYIEQLIEDAPSSPFSTVGNTEKPDVAAAKLLEGRVAVLVDGSPSVLTVPRLFCRRISMCRRLLLPSLLCQHCPDGQVDGFFYQFTSSGNLCSFRNLSPGIYSHFFAAYYGCRRLRYSFPGGSRNTWYGTGF